MSKTRTEQTTAPTITASIAPGEIIIGTLSGLDSEGKPLVDFSENPSHQPVPAMSTIALNQQHAGRQVALLFANGDISRPVIMGLIHNPLQEMIEALELTPQTSDAPENTQPDQPHQQVDLDGKRLVFEADQEIVFRCGEASITLTRAGKILIRGKYILNRSSGVNRIMGGSVQVN